MSSVILRLLVRVQLGGQGFLFLKTTNATNTYFMLYPIVVMNVVTFIYVL